MTILIPVVAVKPPAGPTSCHSIVRLGVFSFGRSFV